MDLVDSQSEETSNNGLMESDELEFARPNELESARPNELESAMPESAKLNLEDQSSIMPNDNPKKWGKKRRVPLKDAANSQNSKKTASPKPRKRTKPNVVTVSRTTRSKTKL